MNEEDVMDTLVAVLEAIGYTEEFAESHPSLKVSEGVKLFLADKAAAVAVGEPEDAYARFEKWASQYTNLPERYDEIPSYLVWQGAIASKAEPAAVPDSPAYALRGLYKPTMEYFIDGKPCTPDEYISWQAGIIEAVTRARLPDPKYYGGSAEEGDQHEVKCAYVDGWNDCRGSILSKSPAPIASAQEAAFQSRVQPWMLACFGAEIAADKMERNHRFFEESTETVQANGMTRSEAHQLVDYVYDRPVGELHQEVGGVMVTLAALCLASGIDMHEAGEVELARVWTKIEKIRAKQAAKPKHSPLPEHTHPAAAQPSED